MTKPEQQSRSETDTRFPSGPWKGFWIQHGNRGWMHLQLEFANGQIVGTGSDQIGPFAISGQYKLADGKVQVSKQYLGQHRVDYAGWAELQHGIWGLWSITDVDRGGWQIWPEGREAGDHLETEEEIPADRPLLGYNP